MMLDIRDLTATIDGKKILDGVDLEIPAGEVHAIMGPNGSGKSTLANVLVGRAGYDVTGSVTFDGIDLLALEPEAVRRERGLAEVSATDFLGMAKEHMARLGMDPAFLSRSVNQGFSGGEKKRNEVLQMSLLEPRLAILDETDSGLDIDALRIVAGGVERMRSPERSMLIITHYPRLLEEVRPDRVHVLSNGRIVRSGGFELANELEADGYASTVAASS